MDENIFSHIIKVSPFPYINLNNAGNNCLNDGLIVSHPSFCKKNYIRKGCEEYYNAITYSEQLQHYICPYGFSVFVANCKGKKIAFSGLIAFPENKICSTQFRKLYNQNKIDSTRVHNWFIKVKDTIPALESVIQSKIKATVAMMHDINKTNSLIKTNLEVLIRRSKGTRYEEKYNNSPECLRSAYKATELLSNQMELINLFSNPNMIKAGKKRYFEIFRFFDKIRMFYLPKSQNKNCKITLISAFSSSIEVYNSFALVPHILMDNAVKYSPRNESIVVTFSETRELIEVQITSIGPLIEEDEKNVIFEMYQKGKNAYNFSAEGSGIGLYIAKKIMEGHGGEIFVESVAKNVDDKGVPLAENMFTLNIPKLFDGS